MGELTSYNHAATANRKEGSLVRSKRSKVLVSDHSRFPGCELYSEVSRFDPEIDAGFRQDQSLASDPWDPRYWPEPVPYRTLTVSRCGEFQAILDEEDYRWALQWAWGVKRSRGKKGIYYAYRVTRCAGGKSYSVFLHVEIMIRAGIRCPYDDRVVDHRNGRTLDCRRANLRWATRSMNRRNLNGQMPFDELVG